MQSKLRVLVQVSVLVALSIVLTRLLSINTLYVRIGFGFVPIALCAMLFGPVWAGVAAALADIIGALLFPMGAYFPGFTITAALTGVVFGLFLYNKEKSLPGLIAAVLINCLVIGLLGNTFNLTLLTGTPFLALLPTRLLQSAVMIPVMFLACGGCSFLAKAYRRQYA